MPRRSAPPPQAPFAGSFLQRVLLALVTLKVAVIVLAVDPYADDSFQLVKVLASHSLGWLLAAAIAAAAVRHGVAVLPRSRLLLVVGAAVLVSGAATLLAEVPALAYYGDVGRYLGFVHVVDMALLTVAVGTALRGRNDWCVLGAGVLGAAMVAEAYAFLQLTGHDPYRWDQTLPFSTFGNTGPFAQFLCVIAVALLAVAVVARGRALRLALGTLLVPTGFLLATIAARSILLGVAGGIAVLGLAGVRRGWDERAGRRAAALGALGVVALAVVLFATPLGRRTLQVVGGGDASFAERAIIYRVALAATAARPVFGWGPDSVAVFEPRFETAAEHSLMKVRNNSAHGWVLQEASTTGLAGLGILVLLIGLTSRALWRARVEERTVALTLLAVYATYWASGLTSVSAASNDWIPWIVVGGVVALTGRAGEGRPLLSPGWRMPVVVGIFLAACVLAATARPVLEASRAVHDARGALREPTNPRAALVLAQRAVTLDATPALYWDLLGFTLYGSARYRDAAAAYEEAVRRAPHQSELWISLARAYARLAALSEPGDNRGRALAAAARAVAATPNDASAHAGRSEVARDLGDAELAFAEGVIAIEQRPADPAFDLLLTGPAISVRDPASARRSVEALVAVRDSAALRLTLAELCVALEDWIAARAHANRALALIPDAPTSRESLEAQTRALLARAAGH